MPKTTLKPGTTYQHENGKTYMVTVQEVTDLTKEKPKRKVKRKPYKKVFQLLSKPDPNDDEAVVQYSVPLYPSGLVKHTDRITYKPKRKTALSCILNYFVPRVEVDYQHGGIWVGATQYPSGSDDACRFWTWDENATAERIIENILRLPNTGFGTYTEQGGWNSGWEHGTDSENIILSTEVWESLSQGLRRRFLREVFAENIYINFGLE